MNYYEVIQNKYKNTFNKTVKPCWISDIKRELGFSMKKRRPRKNPDIIENPCPEGDIKIRLKEIILEVYSTS
jgi:hypothetical protein